MCTGFGEVGMETSFWLGLEALYQLTTNGAYTRMRVEMYANEGAWYSAEYGHFSVESESQEYRLTISDTLETLVTICGRATVRRSARTTRE